MKNYCHNEHPFIHITEFERNRLIKVDIMKCAEPVESPVKFYKRMEKKPDVLINGGLFYMKDGTPVLTLKDEGKIEHHESWLELGMGIVGDNQIVNGSLHDGNNYRDFVSGYPILIKNGERQKITYAVELNYRARRTVVGWNKDNVYVVTVDAPGMTLTELQGVLLVMGVTEAVNLDGGGSTIKIANDEICTTSTYVRPVDNVVAFYVNKHRTVYRVQVGAFQSKQNAENLRKIVSELPDEINAGYKNAFIKEVNGLYKVQIGAFSNKKNTRTVVYDLKEKGISPYVVEDSI